MKTPEILFDKKRLYEIDCYCCNRHEHFEPVIQFLEDKQSENQLHIFIPSYPYDAPESFVTRVVHLYFPVNNFHSPNIRNGESTSAIKLVETPIELSKKTLGKIGDDITTYSASQYPENIALFYRLHLKNWDPKDCQKFIDDVGLNKLPSMPGKKIRIFYWLDLTDCRLISSGMKKFFRKSKSQFEIMQTACQGREHIHFLKPLPFVKRSDLHTWFSHFCSYESAYESYVASIFGEQNYLPIEKIEWHLLPLFNKTNKYRQ